MLLPRSRVFGLILVAVLLCLAMVAAFSTQIPPVFSVGSADHLSASFWFFDRFYLDFAIFALVGVFLINSGPILRSVAYLWMLLFVGFYITQFLSTYIGGEFVSILAIDNAFHWSLLRNQRSLTALLVIIAATALGIYLLEVKFRHRSSWPLVVIVAGFIFGFGMFIEHHRVWVSESVVRIRDGIYQQRDIRLAHRSPMESLFRTVFRPQKVSAEKFTQQDAESALDYGVSIRPEQRFPLIKSEIFSTPLPFPKHPNAVDTPNVIILFAEGLSARTVGRYHHLVPDLTPNIDEFSRQAMVVNNYYNHTYATYRGLLGQLCSIFPARGGLGGWHDEFQSLKKVNYFCLSDLFNEAGYETIFLDTHRRDAGYIDEMMEQIHFKRVINAEQVRDQYIDQEPLREDALSDNQLMEGLIEILKEREANPAGIPFMLGTYNLETHAWQKIASDGKRYSHQDNYVLDSIHNYDHAFGRFWRYFQQSSYFDNTILILTTDHAHYPGRDFVEVVAGDTGYRPYFVDQIPLMIYDPGKILPAEFDANYASAIDFAPSMAHWLGFNSSNPFVGNSVFSRQQQPSGKSVAAAGEEYFLIDNVGVRRNDDVEVDDIEMGFIIKMIDSIYQLEQYNRIWPGQ